MQLRINWFVDLHDHHTNVLHFMPCGYNNQGLDIIRGVSDIAKQIDWATLNVICRKIFGELGFGLERNQSRDASAARSVALPGSLDSYLGPIVSLY